MPSAILSATVARIAKKAGLALLATCLPVVAHAQSYTYDAAGQLTQSTAADGSTLTIGHDRHGRANHYSDSQRGQLTLALDKLGRQASETTAHGQTQSQTQTQWDAASQRTQISAHFENHSPHTIKATWDAAGRLQSLKANTNPSGPITRLTHDAAGRLTQMQRANGSTSHWRYSADGHFTEIHHQSASGQTLARYRYERDAKGRLTQASEQTAGQSETIKTWQYDADGKLTKESVQQAGQSHSCTYVYDSVGNRTEKDCDGHKTSYSYNELDQLTQESSPSHTITYRWDARGNLIEKQTPQQTTHYRWSADNRLTEVQSGNTRVSYGYDALGRRISRTWQQGNHTRETQWVLDTARPYSEIVLERTRSNGGAWKETRYIHTPEGVGLQISESEEGQTRHIYTDAQGSTRLITDEAGNVLQTLDYDAFGNEQGSGPTRHRYTGESFDEETGLYHLRARDYDPRTGRFISMDEHPGSRTIPLTLNKYLYGNADPVNHIDPSGNFFTLNGISTSVGRQLQIVRMSFINGGRRAGGAAIRKLGELVENRIGSIIKQCLKPGVKLNKHFKTGDGKVTIDLFLQKGEKAKAVEIKYQLGRASSESFARAARQLRSAFKHTDDVVLISFKQISEKYKKSLLEKIGNPSAGAQIGAMLELSTMLGEFVMEGCIR